MLRISMLRIMEHSEKSRLKKTSSGTCCRSHFTAPLTAEQNVTRDSAVWGSTLHNRPSGALHWFPSEVN